MVRGWIFYVFTWKKTENPLILKVSHIGVETRINGACENNYKICIIPRTYLVFHGNNRENKGANESVSWWKMNIRPVLVSRSILVRELKVAIRLGIWNLPYENCKAWFISSSVKFTGGNVMNKPGSIPLLGGSHMIDEYCMYVLVE